MVFYQIVISMIPSDQYDRQSSLQLIFIAFIMILCYYTDSGMQILSNLVAMNVMFFVPHTLVYGNSFTMIRVMEAIYLSLLYLFLTSLIAIIIRQISQLHMKLRTQNEQNARLLNGMHEGLIIVSKKKDQKVLYSNRPIQKFINAAISAVESNGDLQQENLDDLDYHWLLSPKLFKPMQVSSKLQQNS